MENKSKNSQNIHISNSSNVSIGNVELNNHASPTTKGEGGKTQVDKVELKSLVAEGAVSEALEKLMVATKGTSARYNEVVLVMGRYTQAQTEKRIGILGNDDYHLESNRIKMAVLEIIDSLK